MNIEIRKSKVVYSVINLLKYHYLKDILFFKKFVMKYF